jgi:hypothetical protein
MIPTFAPNSPLDGIISYLTRKYQGNVHDLDIVRISASSIEGGTLQSLVNLNIPCDFYTYDMENSWICYDFKTMRISITHYSIRNRSGYDSGFPRNWILEGSIDGSQWVLLDQQTNNSELVGRSKTVTFSVSHQQDIRLVWMVRIRQTGRNSTRGRYLSLAGLEFFGTVQFE